MSRKKNPLHGLLLAEVAQPNYQAYAIAHAVNRRHRRALRTCTIIDHRGKKYIRITARENFYYLAHHERAARHAQN